MQIRSSILSRKRIWHKKENRKNRVVRRLRNRTSEISIYSYIATLS